MRLRHRVRDRGAQALRRVSQRRFESAFGSIFGAETQAPVFALTFDDGPCPVNTPPILDVLADHGATATFFLLVRNAEASPGLVTEILARGHEIGLHTRSHIDLTQTSARRLWAEIHGARAQLERIAGQPVRLFRPPYGVQNLRSLSVARLEGLEIVAWSAAARDCLALPQEQQVAIAMRELAPGGILLLHDGVPEAPVRCAALLAALLDETTRDGLRPTTVTDLLRAGEPVRRTWFLRREQTLSDEVHPLWVVAEAEADLSQI